MHAADNKSVVESVRQGMMWHLSRNRQVQRINDCVQKNQQNIGIDFTLIMLTDLGKLCI